MGVKVMATGRTWMQKDKEYLNEKWGSVSLNYLAKYLNRTQLAVALKAKRMRLGASTRADEYMTANQVSVMLNVDRHIITRIWIKNSNLKAVRKATLFERKFWLIKHCDLIEWLENNQDKFSSCRVGLYSLGYEPEWLKEKRKRDNKLPINRFKKWTKLETQRVILYAKEMPYKKIAEIMGRSCRSIEKKMYRLKATGNII